MAWLLARASLSFSVSCFVTVPRTSLHANYRACHRLPTTQCPLPESLPPNRRKKGKKNSPRSNPLPSPFFRPPPLFPLLAPPLLLIEPPQPSASAPAPCRSPQTKERHTSLPRDSNASWGESFPRRCLLPANDPAPYPAADASTAAPLSACALIQSPDPARLPAALQIGAAAPSPPRCSPAAAEALRLPRRSRCSSAAEGETGGRQVPCSACGPPMDVAAPRRPCHPRHRTRYDSMELI